MFFEPSTLKCDHSAFLRTCFTTAESKDRPSAHAFYIKVDIDVDSADELREFGETNNCGIWHYGLHLAENDSIFICGFDEFNLLGKNLENPKFIWHENCLKGIYELTEVCLDLDKTSLHIELVTDEKRFTEHQLKLPE